jgi:hypothetical protein
MAIIRVYAGMDGESHFEEITPKLEPRGPVEILSSQFAEFLDHVEHRTAPEADVRRCGVDMAALLEAIAESARSNRPVSCAAGA